MKLHAAILLTLLTWSASESFAMPDIDFQVPETCSSRKEPSENVVVDLDLGSGRECVPASLAFDSEHYKKKVVSVTEGDNVRVISRNCMLTAGEYFAAKCNMTGKEPEFDLSERGTISSGAVTLDKFTVEHCRSLYLPKHITIKHDVSRIPVLKLEGILQIDGNYLLIGTAKTCSIIAKQVKVAASGFLGSPKGQAPIEVQMEAPDGLDLGYVPPSEKPNETTRKVVYSKNEKGERQDLAVVDSAFKLEKVQRMMFKTTPQLIPVDGQDVAPIEGGMEQQERESCAKSQ